jgi:integrase
VKGDGTIYKRGKVWWMKFYRDGRAFSMSAQTTVKEVAKNRLRDEVTKARGSQWLDPKQRAVTVGELIDDLIIWYRTVGGKPVMATACETAWNLHLKSHFGHVRAEALGTNHQREYREKRLSEDAAPATINREIQYLRRAYKIALRAEPAKVTRVPRFEITSEDNARKVFLDEVTMDKMRTAASSLGLWQRVAVEIAFTYGWRRSELFFLRVRDVNLVQRLLRLETSKNKEPREVPITENLSVLLQALIVGMQPDEKLMPCSPSGFRHTWNKICDLAGVKAGKKDGFVLHDARRSSARNKSAAGVSSRVIMQMQGWKSEAMFRRYAIVDQSDMKRALEMEAQQREANKQNEAVPEQLQYSYSGTVYKA